MGERRVVKSSELDLDRKGPRRDLEKQGPSPRSPILGQSQCLGPRALTTTAILPGPSYESRYKEYLDGSEVHSGEANTTTQVFGCPFEGESRQIAVAAGSLMGIRKRKRFDPVFEDMRNPKPRRSSPSLAGSSGLATPVAMVSPFSEE